MISYIRAHILAWLAPKHRLRCRTALWTKIVEELARRGAGERESGAFLLGRSLNGRGEVLDVVYYDDLAPTALVAGAILFPGSAYGALWRICGERGMQVVADIHTHPNRAYQSSIDSEHPMIAQAGHLALILPRYAQTPLVDTEIGFYEYLGGRRWKNHSGAEVTSIFLRTML